MFLWRRLSFRLLVILLGLASSLPTQAFTPNYTLTISTLHIASPIIEFVLEDVSWRIDPWEINIGHLEGTAWFGEPGNIVLAGHSRMPDGKPGIFGSLDQLKIGSEIIVSASAHKQRYLVTEVVTVAPEDLSVVSPTPEERLTLITCDVSSYHAENQTYARRLVVIAQRSD